MSPTFRTSQTVSVADPSRPHLILVGLPGCGKSDVGRRVAEQTGRGFLDFDAEIERREGMPVSRIFAEQGEPRFRQLEQGLTRELQELGGMILAPGGGWITNPDVVALLRPPGRLVYLQVKPETALKRMGASTEQRPLLMRPKPLEELKRLFEERRLLYEGADLTVDSQHLTLQEVIDAVVAFAIELR